MVPPQTIWLTVRPCLYMSIQCRKWKQRTFEELEFAFDLELRLFLHQLEARELEAQRPRERAPQRRVQLWRLWRRCSGGCRICRCCCCHDCACACHCAGERSRQQCRRRHSRGLVAVATLLLMSPPNRAAAVCIFNVFLDSITSIMNAIQRYLKCAIMTT